MMIKATVLLKNTSDLIFDKGQTFFLLSLIIVSPKQLSR